MRLLRCYSRFFTPSFPRKRESRRLATRNQVQTAVSASSLYFKGLQGQVDAKFNEAIVAPPLRLPPSFPPSITVIPAKAGIQMARHTKSSTNGSQRIPSPFMGLQG